MGRSTDEREDQIWAALGEDWAELRSVTKGWFEDNRAILEDRWSGTHNNDADRLSYELGVYLYDPSDGSQYMPDGSRPDGAPANSYTFASTGVDGDHLNVLLDEAVSGVIVATAPMAGRRRNIVVAESMRDFLNLSCRCGLGAAIELLHIDFQRASTGIQEPQEPSQLMDHLRQELGLVPWVDLEGRIDELQDRYRSAIVPSQWETSEQHIDNNQVEADIEMAEIVFRATDGRAGDLWEQVRIEPQEWTINQYDPITNASAWVVAVLEQRCLYYNDVEEGWGWGRYTQWGEIVGFHWEQSTLDHAISQNLLD